MFDRPARRMMAALERNEAVVTAIDWVGFDMYRRNQFEREQNVLAWLERISDQHPEFARVMTAKLIPTERERRAWR